MVKITGRAKHLIYNFTAKAMDKIKPIFTLRTMIIYQQGPDLMPESAGGITRARSYSRIKVAVQDSSTIRQRLGRGDACYIIAREGKSIGYGWVAHRSFELDEIEWKYSMDEKDYFIYDCFIDKDQRGRGLYPILLKHILGVEKGRPLIAVDSLNRSSVRGIIKAGFVPLEKITLIKLAGMKKYFFRTLKP